jgi:hypothetical protein
MVIILGLLSNMRGFPSFVSSVALFAMEWGVVWVSVGDYIQVLPQNYSMDLGFGLLRLLNGRGLPGFGLTKQLFIHPLSMIFRPFLVVSQWKMVVCLPIPVQQMILEVLLGPPVCRWIVLRVV